MGKETEKRYLVGSGAWKAKAGRGVHLEQGYLSTYPERNVRVRLGGNRAVLTVKGEAQGPSRSEYEYRIPPAEARKILDENCIKPILEKTRYTLGLNGYSWEVDEYSKENEGLTIVEVEFTGKGPRSKPGWVGREISDDQRYSNASLVSHPYSQWRSAEVKEAAKFHLKHKESIADGLLRVQNEQLNIAIQELSRRDDDLDGAIHEVRKAIKKVRSVLRLMRQALPALYRKENCELQQVGRKLSELRDAQALIESLANLEKRYEKELAGVELSPIQRELAQRKVRVSQTVGSTEQLAQFTAKLTEIQTRLKGADMKPVDAAALTKALAKTVKRARMAHGAAFDEGTPEAFHEWRKRVKDFRYQLDLLHKLWPDVLGAFTDSAKSLEQRLGDHHNLDVLHQTLSDTPDDFGRGKTLRKLFQVIELDRERLQDDADSCGRLLFTDKPSAWVKRLNACWASWLK
jgi:adenylate cyclase